MSIEDKIEIKIAEIRQILLRRSSNVVEFAEKILWKIENNEETEFSYLVELSSLDLALDFSEDNKNDIDEFNEFMDYWLK